MAMEQHLATLRKRKMELDLMILAEHARPLPDDVRLHHLKKQKLSLNDDITRLSYVKDAA